MRPRHLARWLLPLLLIAIAWPWRGALVLPLAERFAERNMTRDPLAGLPDGIHVMICGAGGPLPDPRRSGPCVAVRAGPLDLLIDAGSGAGRSLTRLRWPLGDLDALLLTHFHSDHIDGLGEVAMLRWVNAANTAALPVLGPSGTSAVVEGFNRAYAADADYRAAHHGESVAPRSGAGLVAREWPLPIAGEGTVLIDRDGVRVTMFAVEHAPVSPAVGYRIDYAGRSVTVSGDTVRSASLERVAKGSELLIHEALSPELVGAMHRAAQAAERPILAKITADIPGYHASPVDAAASASAIGASHLVLYHVVPPLLMPGMEAVFLRGVDAIWDGPVTVAVDGSFFSLPAGSSAIEAR
jgi:ribonuclease Z